MKKLSFALVGAAALALAACGGKQENAVENVDENLATENLEVMANEAAANEADALANQQETLNAEANAADTSTEADAEAANVNAM